MFLFQHNEERGGRHKASSRDGSRTGSSDVTDPSSLTGTGRSAQKPVPGVPVMWSGTGETEARKSRNRQAAQRSALHRPPDLSICAGWAGGPPRGSDITTSRRRHRLPAPPASGLDRGLDAAVLVAGSADHGVLGFFVEG